MVGSVTSPVQHDIAEYKKALKSKYAAGEYAPSQINTLQKRLEATNSLQPGKGSRRHNSDGGPIRR
ncbi:hypothetical protein FXB41_36685 [Bradyrhizobium canariense]|nr:hypothetical protein [Bradyrhizobium canariense]